MEQIEILKKALHDAEAIVVGAGAGLSTSAGFIYSGERFEFYFNDFIQKYGFTDMFSGGFYPFPTHEEFWAYWSRYIYVNRYMDAPKPIYQKLLKLVQEKEYFVITTNVDHCFQKAGFDKKRLFYTQGDYGLFQCSVPCHSKTYGNEDVIRKMVDKQRDMRVPTELLPYCPVCKMPMTMNLRSDNKFVEDEGWLAAADRYERFLNENQNKRILFLELGVGYNTPVIIKYPFWRMTQSNPNAFYACVNLGQAACPKEIAERSVCINEDIGMVIGHLTHTEEVEDEQTE